jgi:hypothetical protein
MSTGQCALCLLTKPLQNSHIIPDFMLKEVEEDIPKGKSGLKQPHMRLINFQTTQEIYCNQKETAYKKEGLKEFLLCWDCEQRLAVGEKYVRCVLYGNKPIKEHTHATRYSIRDRHRNGQVFQEGVEIRWVEFQRFKQFQIGVIWKACQAKGNFFEAATAPASTIESMRQSILTGNHDEQLVPCVMRRLHDPTGWVMELIGRPKSHPELSSIGMVMGGYIWDFFVRGNVDRRFALQAHGKLAIQIVDVKEWACAENRAQVKKDTER